MQDRRHAQGALFQWLCSHSRLSSLYDAEDQKTKRQSSSTAAGFKVLQGNPRDVSLGLPHLKHKKENGILANLTFGCSFFLKFLSH